MAPEFRVLRLNLRGHGRSGHIEGGLTLDDFVRDVVDVLDACSVSAANIVGFSLGGMIAPTLIATGEHDTGSNVRMARFMHAQIEGSRLEILPGLRHSILVEAPEPVTRLVRAFLRE